MNIRICLLTPGLFLIFISTALAQVPTLKDIPTPDPELEKATFKVPEGFEVNLFAADPSIAKPIQMNFDEDGRLWIASSEVYPSNSLVARLALEKRGRSSFLGPYPE